MKELLEKIKQYNAAYRSGNPIVSDSEYDKLVDELKSLDPNNDWFKSPEPVYTSTARKIKLPIPMKSLNKVKSVQDLKKWCQSIGLKTQSQVVCMPKFDGISMLHDEINGTTYSRGGSENEGQNCTAHFNKAEIYTTNSPLRFTFGEFVFSRIDWEKFKHDAKPNAEEQFKSPRNTAAGLINRDIPSDYLKYISFFRYGTDESSLNSYDTFSSFINNVCEQYHQQKLFKLILVENLTDECLASLFKLWSKEYPIDGIVVYANDIEIWNTVGRNETTGNPIYAIAYKHPDFTDAFETTVKGISWKVNKSGALKPVVNIETIDTGDCNMENPTGYNANWVRQHNIARGAGILVTRSGGVIPKILETIKPPKHKDVEELWQSLCFCPHCGSPTAWNNSHVELCCTNTNCSGIKLAKMVFFYNTLCAENMGEETISKIFNAGFDSIPKILRITFDDLMEIDGFAEITANIVLQNNRKIMKGIELPILMQASDCFKGIETIKARKWIDSLSDEELQGFCDGSYITQPIDITDKHFKLLSVDKQNILLGYMSFSQFITQTGIPIIIPSKEFHEDGKCNGFSVCMSGFRSNELEKKIISSGGNVVSNVSKKTTHLIVKDKTSTSSKISKAIQLNIKVMDIDEFTYCYLS